MTTFSSVTTWTIPTSLPIPLSLNGPLFSFPHPTFNSYYVTAAEGSAWQALYKNTDGLRDSWAQYWALLAGLWKDEPTVLGYELINEPFAGDVIKYPELLVPGAADANNLVRCDPVATPSRSRRDPVAISSRSRLAPNVSCF